MEYKKTNASNPDFIQLCHELDIFLNQIAGGEAMRSQYIPYNQTVDIDDVVIAYDQEYAIGCAGIKRFDSERAEVKRVFVRESHRGRGVSRQLMILLEKRALEKGYNTLVLESGEPLTAAMRLYREIGFKAISNYGPYEGMDDAICMEKKLR